MEKASKRVRTNDCLEIKSETLLSKNLFKIFLSQITGFILGIRTFYITVLDAIMKSASDGEIISCSDISHTLSTIYTIFCREKLSHVTITLNGDKIGHYDAFGKIILLPGVLKLSKTDYRMLKSQREEHYKEIKAHVDCIRKLICDCFDSCYDTSDSSQRKLRHVLFYEDEISLVQQFIKTFKESFCESSVGALNYVSHVSCLKYFMINSSSYKKNRASLCELFKNYEKPQAIDHGVDYTCA